MLLGGGSGLVELTLSAAPGLLLLAGVFAVAVAFALGFVVVLVVVFVVLFVFVGLGVVVDGGETVPPPATPSSPSPDASFDSSSPGNFTPCSSPFVAPVPSPPPPATISPTG